MENIYVEIEKLLNFSYNHNFVEKEDIIYMRNSLLSLFNLDENKEIENKNFKDEHIYEILDRICDYAVNNNMIENTVDQRDIFDSKVMGILVPRPSQVIKKFKNDYVVSPKNATDNYYEFSKNTNYIRINRINRNLNWLSNTKYGNLEITINLSKPEKDPKDIAKAKLMVHSYYPKCLLCKENEGYSGRVNHPARQNHRIIPLTLTNEPWFMQYSPYVYYNEHSIIFSGTHRPMQISKNSFKRILEFLETFPHYFIGSNADLPIVGGSILSHDHFQAGNHTFPMEIADIEEIFKIKNYEDIEVGKVKWPMSVIRLKSKNKEKLIELSDKILTTWRSYEDIKCNIIPFTKNIPHNTITPIARIKNNIFEIDLVLRNNRTNEKYPLGIFHPHQELHNIKKENIGLIEVMGLAVLPGRLKEEMEILIDFILKENALELIKTNEKVNKHINFVKNILTKYNDINKDNIENILKEEIGIAFSKVLENAGVYKRNEKGILGFRRFINSL